MSSCSMLDVGGPGGGMQDKEYQRLRDAAVAIIREMGVECGGSNVQMGINPEDGANLHSHEQDMNLSASHTSKQYNRA